MNSLCLSQLHREYDSELSAVSQCNPYACEFNRDTISSALQRAARSALHSLCGGELRLLLSGGLVCRCHSCAVASEGAVGKEVQAQSPPQTNINITSPRQRALFTIMNWIRPVHRLANMCSMFAKRGGASYGLVVVLAAPALRGGGIPGPVTGAEGRRGQYVGRYQLPGFGESSMDSLYNSVAASVLRTCHEW